MTPFKMRTVLVIIACFQAGCNPAREPETKAIPSQMLLDLQSIIAKQLGKNAADVNPDLTFAALGADELDLVEITMEVEDTFGIGIRIESLATASGISGAETLCSRLTVRAFATVAESSPKQSLRAAQSKTADSGTLQESQVGKFSELSQLPNPNGLVLVFIPRLEELIKISEQRLGRKMDVDEIETLRQNAAVIALPPQMAEKLNRDKPPPEAVPIE
jgi:acyl carrier protein